MVVPYSVSEMYALVDDVENYPEFLPWCKASHILERNDDEVQATLELSAGGFQKSFTTHNLLQKNKMIEIRLIHGPFKHLEGFWRFDEVPQNKSQVSLDLEFEFSNHLLSLAFMPFFHPAINSLVEAFSERAVAVYGKR